MLESFLGLFGSSSASATAGASSAGGGMFDFLGSEGMGNFGTALQGIGSIVNGLGGWQSARNQIKEQKRYNDLVERQFNEEKARYDTYKKERDEAKAIIGESASRYITPAQAKMGSILSGMGN